MADIITAKNLCLWYGDTQALKSINIAVPEHSITALIGPSGCGKSTFLKTLNRMNDLIPGVRITGDVRYEGRDIFQAEVNNLRKEVGMVFQKPNPFPMSIYDNIAYGPRTHGIHNKAKLDEIAKYSHYQVQPVRFLEDGTLVEAERKKPQTQTSRRRFRR